MTQLSSHFVGGEYAMKICQFGTLFVMDGVSIFHDRANLKLVVTDPDDGVVEISGFENSNQMSDFAMVGDFTDSPANDFFLCVGEKLDLRWRFLSID